MTRCAALCAALALAASLPAAQLSCHIHPPAADAAEADGAARPATIGPFGGRSACEGTRRLLFGSAGRCHCAFGFAGLPGGGDAAPGDPPPTAVDLPEGAAALP